MIIQSDALKIPLQDNSAHCVITSPPYWGLRDYGTARWQGGRLGCDHKVPLSVKGGNAVGTKQTTNPGSYGYREWLICGKCGAKRIDPQLGLEKTPEEYVAKMVKVFREVWRVLRPEGTCWINMGDGYATSGHQNSRDIKGKHLIGGGLRSWGEDRQNTMKTIGIGGLKPKDLCGIPWRLAFALQADGWYLRSDIIWAKLNPMPESVAGSRWEKHRITRKDYENLSKMRRIKDGSYLPELQFDEGESEDFFLIDCPGCPKCEKNDGYVLRMSAGRPTKSHEYIFLLTKSPHYFLDQEAVREPHSPDGRKDTEFKGSTKYADGFGPSTNTSSLVGHERWPGNGRNIRTVWTIATQPFKGAHFATFPEKLVERCILAGTSEKGCCPKCGAPRVRIVEAQGKYAEALQKETWKSGGLEKDNAKPAGYDRLSKETKTLGWRPSCKCFGDEWNIPDSKPCMVLDPFFVAGTVGVVCQKFNRKFIGLDLKMDYCKMADARMKAKDIAMI